MKKFLIFAILLALYGCTSDDPSEIVKPEPVEIHWSLSGTFGNATVDSAKADTELPRMVKRTGTSTMHLDGFDTAYFDKKISLRHLQVSAGDEVDIDDNGKDYPESQGKRNTPAIGHHSLFLYRRLLPVPINEFE